MTTGARSELITIGDLKNWGYCPRVVYYRRFLPGAAVATYKMKAGIAAQDVVERLEVRRTLARYGYESQKGNSVIRKFGLWLVDEELGLSGKVDVLLERWDDGAVVDFKLTSGEPGENHRLQLGGYALLVEAKMDIRVPVGFLVRIPDEKVFEVPIDADLRERVRVGLASMKRMIETEWYPEATEVRGRCRDCEYANYCGDVW